MSWRSQGLSRTRNSFLSLLSSLSFLLTRASWIHMAVTLIFSRHIVRSLVTFSTRRRLEAMYHVMKAVVNIGIDVRIIGCPP